MPPRRPRNTEGTDTPPAVEVLPAKQRRWRTELTLELIDEFVALAPTLARRDHIALALSVPPALFHWWMCEGKRHDSHPLMQELCVRYSAARSVRIVSVSGALADKAMFDPETAGAVLGRVEGPNAEQEPTMPDQSLDDRRAQMTAALREASPDIMGVLEEALSGDSPLREQLIKRLGK